MGMGPRDRHCRRTGCRCTHEAPCDRGWVDRLDEHGLTLDTRPCLTCRADLAAVVLPAQDRVELRRALATHRGDRWPVV